MSTYSNFAMYAGATIFRGKETQVLKSTYYNVYSRIDEYNFEHVRSIYEVKITIKYVTQAGFNKKIVIRFNHDIRLLLQRIINTVAEDVNNIAYNCKVDNKLINILDKINLYKKRTNLLSCIAPWKHIRKDSYSNLETILTE